MQNRFVRNASQGRILEIFQRIKYIYSEKKGWYFFLYFVHDVCMAFVQFMHFHFLFVESIQCCFLLLFFSYWISGTFSTVNAFSRHFFPTLLNVLLLDGTQCLLNVLFCYYRDLYALSCAHKLFKIQLTKEKDGIFQPSFFLILRCIFSLFQSLYISWSMLLVR